MAINEQGVEKNVGAGIFQGARAAMTTLAVSGGLSCLLAVASLALPSGAQARAASGSGEPVVLASLPREAQQTERLILSGGPFRHAQDGVVFSNREGRLPRERRGYYHEYTVPTPGAHDRGARRIVCGGAKPTEPDDCFYTEDHYNSFHRIVQ